MNHIGQINNTPALPGVYETKNTLRDESGYNLQLDTVSFNHINLKWGSYINPHEKMLHFHPNQSSIVSHFGMFDPIKTTGYRNKHSFEKQFVVYREKPESYELCIEPTAGKARTFFELAISEHFFSRLFTHESEFLSRFQNFATDTMPSMDFVATISADMYNIIHDMRLAPYKGYLKGLYLESKAIELFLTQVSQLDRGIAATLSKLNARDIDSLHDIKHYLDLNYTQPCSIIKLAEMAGINQTKLKTGFRELFHTTVFGYLNDLRMQEAKRLLLEEKLYVNEVADIIGYKHPHHFTAAFKKKFGIVPKDLKM